MARTYLGYAENLRNAPLDVTALPIAATTADRDAGFADPATGQRVQNLETGNIERWDGASWVTDFYGAGVPFAVQAAYVEPGTFGSAVGADPGDLYAVPGDFGVGGDLDVTGYVQTPRLRGVAAAIALGVAVAGANVAADNFTFVAPLSTGNAPPAALVWQVGVQGSSGSTPQTLTEAFRVQQIANASGREVVAANYTGPLSGRLPANTAAALLVAGDGMRTQEASRVIRIGGAPAFIGTRVGGTLAAPTQTLAGNTTVSLVANALTDTGAVVTIGLLSNAPRQNITSTAYGSSWGFAVTDNGSTTLKDVFIVRGGGTNIAELLSGQSTFRLIPGATQFAIRNSGNTADTFTINAAGTAITAPLATAFVVGVDPGSSQTFRVGGNVNITGAGLTSLFNSSGGGNTPLLPTIRVLEATNGHNLALEGFNRASMYFYSTNHTASERVWGWWTESSGGIRYLRLSTFTDAGAIGANSISFRRSGTTPISVDFHAQRLIGIETIELNGSGSARFGTDASGTNVVAGTFAFRGPRSTGNATPAGFLWALTSPGASGSAVQGGYFTAMTLTWLSASKGLFAVTGAMDASDEYRVNGTKVVGAQGAAVSDATGAGDVVAQLNTLLSRIRAHGLIAT